MARALRHAGLLAVLALAAALSGCGVVYVSPTVGAGGADVRVVAITAESVLLANASPYEPRALPASFSQTAGLSAPSGATATVPAPVSGGVVDVMAGGTRLPPEADPGPYRIGVGDLVALTMPSADAETAAETGLAALRTMTYAVQDDGAIALPEIGRIAVAGLTLVEAEAAMFERLVENQIDPTFSVEVTGFNSARVAVGGAVGQPGPVPITLAALYLDDAISLAGGADAPDRSRAMVRLYRDGELWQVPLDAVYDGGPGRVRVLPGDSVFVDTASDLDQAQEYFGEQIQAAQLRQSARQAALSELSTVVNLRRAELAEARDSFRARLDLDAEARDYVYLAGEVSNQGRFPLPFGRRATLADALFADAEGIPLTTGNVAEIYLMRASPDPAEGGAVTAWRLDAREATNLVLATRMELRPDDVIFVAEQPVTRWNRVIQQITPSLITATVAQAGG